MIGVCGCIVALLAACGRIGMAGTCSNVPGSLEQSRDSGRTGVIYWNANKLFLINTPTDVCRQKSTPANGIGGSRLAACDGREGGIRQQTIVRIGHSILSDAIPPCG